MKNNKKPNWTRRRPLFSYPQVKAIEKTKLRWKAFPIIWLAMKRGAMVLGFMMFFSIALSVFMAATLITQGPEPLPDQAALVLNFEGTLYDRPPPPSFTEPFALQKPTVRDFVQAIKIAKDDPRVSGILARMKDGSFSLAHIQEIRAAIEDFRESGKYAYIYSSSLGGLGGGLGRYYLASAFDEIWMQPLGVVSIPGINAEMPFLRGTLDKLGVTPEFFKRKAFKTAYENITDSEMSPENRRMLTEMIGSLKGVLVAEIAQDRDMSEAQFEALVNKGLFTADAALSAGLIDQMDYADVLLDRTVQDISGIPASDMKPEDWPLIAPEQLLADVDPSYGQRPVMPSQGNGKPKIALVHAVGVIMPNADTGASVVFNTGIAAADEIAPSILDAVDEGAEVIVLRVDSPGGSPVASESILRALEKAKAKDIPVIVSMGPTAASGGYWIATNADQIFALPTTITGSIGVVGGKFSIAEMSEKIGAKWDSVSWGRNSGIWSSARTFSDSEAAQFNLMLDSVYEKFLSRVANGRKMSIPEVERIAQGRVWTGAQALDIGLVDQLGGLDKALDYAALQLGEIGQSALDIQIYPKPKTPFEELLDIIGGSGDVTATMALQGLALQTVRPALQAGYAVQNPELFQAYHALEIR